MTFEALFIHALRHPLARALGHIFGLPKVLQLHSVGHANFTDYSRRPRLTIFSGASVRTHFSVLRNSLTQGLMTWHLPRVGWNLFSLFSSQVLFQLCECECSGFRWWGSAVSAETSLRRVIEHALMKVKDNSCLDLATELFSTKLGHKGRLESMQIPTRSVLMCFKNTRQLCERNLRSTFF
jgi:hypothetical protein